MIEPFCTLTVEVITKLKGNFMIIGKTKFKKRLMDMSDIFNSIAFGKLWK